MFYSLIHARSIWVISRIGNRINTKRYSEIIRKTPDYFISFNTHLSNGIPNQTQQRKLFFTNLIVCDMMYKTVSINAASLQESNMFHW